MEQKEVKIIGLKVNHQLGILQSCELQFDENNKLIAVLGEVGAGKTTLQKGLMLGTQGSEALKDDKSLYGTIDEEVQLLDGEHNIFVGCKTNKDGALDYVLYTKDKDGKVDKNPVIDGVKATPATYLKNLQTALTWRMDELMSENSTIQRNILLDLYKEDLIKAGVVFDKKSDKYTESILGQIELAENKRYEKEFKRKQVGGFANQLEPLGIDVNNEDTYPVKRDITELEKKANKIKYDIENVAQAKTQRLDSLKNKADSIVLKLKEENNKIKEHNRLLEKEFEEKKAAYKQNERVSQGIKADLQTLYDSKCLSEEGLRNVTTSLNDNLLIQEPLCEQLNEVLEFDDNGKLITKEWNQQDTIGELLVQLSEVRKEYAETTNAPLSDTTELDKEFEFINNDIFLAKEHNKKVDMLDAFLAWKEANEEVIKLRNEYVGLLQSINTGVDGLNINVDKEDSKLEIYLTYDGSYDTHYFNNEKKEKRKLSSYSGTQKPMICLLLQNYLLSKKPKAMRYLWIDNVPIDKKTKMLLERMGEELNLTIFVNITGDFDKNVLKNGEILIQGGEIFFKN